MRHLLPNIPETIHHLQQFKTKHRLVLVLALMIFFFMVCDGIVGFFVPIAISDMGLNHLQTGILIGSSSFAGLLFDQFLLRVIKQPHFRRLYLYMFLFAVLLPLIIWKSSSVVLFLLGMTVWGVYYDLFNCGTMDFVGRYSKKTDHTKDFGIIAVFFSLAYFLAPLIASSFTDERVHGTPFIVAYLFLAVAFSLFLFLKKATNKKLSHALPEQTVLIKKTDRIGFFRVVRILLPILLVSMIMNIVESTYWTIAPQIEHIEGFSYNFGGILMSLHQMPILFIGWFAGKLSEKHSKKHVAFLALMMGSLFLTSFFFIHHPYLILLVNVLASCCFAFVWPMINALYAGQDIQTPEHETQIETAHDSFTNIGYIIGPVIGGLIAQLAGPLQTFAWIGVIGVVLSTFLFITTPRHLIIHRKNQTSHSTS